MYLLILPNRAFKHQSQQAMIMDLWFKLELDVEFIVLYCLQGVYDVTNLKRIYPSSFWKILQNFEINLKNNKTQYSYIENFCW